MSFSIAPSGRFAAAIGIGVNLPISRRESQRFTACQFVPSRHVGLVPVPHNELNSLSARGFVNYVSFRHFMIRVAAYKGAGTAIDAEQPALVSAALDFWRVLP